MQKIFNSILVFIFITLVLLFVYKTISKPNIFTASINSNNLEKEMSGSYDKEELNKIIKDYIINNPEDIIAAVESLQQRKIEESTKQTSEYIEKNKKNIEDEGTPPTFGNEKGDITIVIFYDYNCSFCKKANEYTKQLIKQDSNVKVILRPIPILGGTSMYAAKVALAMHKISKDKFPIIHDGIMNMKIITAESVKELLIKNEIDYDIVENEVNSYSTNELINKNFALAKSLGINGAPSYVINGKFLPGLINLEKFTSLIKDIRDKDIRDSASKL